MHRTKNVGGQGTNLCPPTFRITHTGQTLTPHRADGREDCGLTRLGTGVVL
jgi:hypothetical protein